MSITCTLSSADSERVLSSYKSVFDTSALFLWSCKLWIKSVFSYSCAVKSDLFYESALSETSSVRLWEADWRFCKDSVIFTEQCSYIKSEQ